MGAIVELGHTGILVRDLPAQRDFYRDVLGLTVTDEDSDRGLVFLSSRPAVEHHELVLQAGRTDDHASVVQQISWRVGEVEELRAFLRIFQANGVPVDRVITHGNAIGVYFFDPEGNRNEVYLQTGDDVPQPFAQPIDLLAVDDVLAVSRELVASVRTGSPAKHP